MLIYFIIAPILVGIFLYICPFAKAGKSIAIAVQAALLALAAYLFFESRGSSIVERVGGFEGTLGITLRMDGLSAAFVLLAAFIFLVASIYSWGEDDSRLFRFLLFIWEGLLTGVLLTGDSFSIFVLLEVATLAVAVLIMYKRDNRSMYDGIFYLMTNAVAMQFFLFGAAYVYKLTGTFDIAAATAVLAELNKSEIILPFALMMTAVSLKCALMPLYSWLPKAHGTPGSPSAVSAILSGLHVKAGVYLFLRISEMFAGVFAQEIFLGLGIATGVLGFILALSQTDIKLILAYSTISQIGIIMIGFNFDSVYSYTGALYHVFSHALFKSALFLCAGIITDVYGTRELARISGVFRRMPLIGVTIVMAVLGITGTPFFNGSISKYFIMSDTEGFVSGAIMFINLGTITTFIKFSGMLGGRLRPLGHAKNKGARVAQLQGVKIDACKKASILALGSLCLLGGIFGEQAVSFLFSVDLQVDAVGYLEKTAYFAASLVVGYLIHEYFVKNSRLLARIGKFDLGFRAACVMLGGFFGALLTITALVAQ